MQDKLIIAALLLLVGGIAGYSLRPSPPSYGDIVEIRERVAKADTILVTDTVYYAQWKTRYDTLISIDSIPYSDTVWIKEYVHVADSTVRACDRALRSCLTSLALRDTVIVYQDRYIKEKPKSLRFELFGVAVTGCAVGAALLK